MRTTLRRLALFLLGVQHPGSSGDAHIAFLRRTRLLNLVPGIGAFVIFPMGLLAYWQGYRGVLVFNSVISAYLVLAIAYVRRTGRERGAISLGITLVAAFFYYLFATGGPFRAGFVWFPLLPLVAFFLLGARRGIVVAVCGLLLLLGHSLLAPHLVAAVVYPPNFMIRFVVFYLVVSAFAFSFEKAREISQASLEQNNRELNRALIELHAATKAAEAANEAKSRFLANMSHEIRTPLNGILGNAELLAASGLTAVQRRCVHDIRSSGDHLLSVVNGILDFSKIEAGELRLESVPLDPAAEVRRAVDSFADEARRKGLALKSEVPAEIPGALCGDPVRLRQVLTNLVGNALKFTERGTVTVSLAEAVDDGGGVEVRFEVRDTGVGIAPGKQAGIFDRFAQADESTTRRFGGTGLGLTISRQLVELMGGRIGVVSREGEGSTFWFSLRLVKGPVCAPSTATGIAAPTAAAADRTRHSGRVLLAEDNRVNREVATAMLAVLGLEAAAVVNGREAVEAWRAGEYDLILMDCQMPEMDGHEAARRIREEEARGLHGGRRVPIVALTANTLAGDRDRSLAAGMDDHLGKPYRIEQLEAVLVRWLKGLERPAAPAPVLPSTGAGRDASAGEGGP